MLTLVKAIRALTSAVFVVLSMQSLDNVLELSKLGNIIPIYEIIDSDLITPIQAYLKYAKLQKHSFLFESVAAGERIGRYSFIGTNPIHILDIVDRDPLDSIQAALHGTFVHVDGLPNFTGGAVGYLGYDCVRFFEPSTARPVADTLGLPDSIMMLYDTVIVFDHVFSNVKIVANVIFTDSNDIPSLYDLACDKIRKVKECLLNDEPTLPPQPPLVQDLDCSINRSEYVNLVDNLKHYITNGDIIQAVPSQRLERKTNLHPFNAYRTLRTVNPSPYMFYIDFGDFQLVGASPETMVKVVDNEMHVSPIAGTRKRGKTPEKDENLATELLNDPKERAEHIMLVDLGRNDVNRVCKPESVKVTSLMRIERYAHVCQP